jgi:hypothetical protein
MALDPPASYATLSRRNKRFYVGRFRLPSLALREGG